LIAARKRQKPFYTNHLVYSHVCNGEAGYF